MRKKPDIDLWPPYACAHVCIHTIQTHTYNEIKVRKLSLNGQKTKISLIFKGKGTHR